MPQAVEVVLYLHGGSHGVERSVHVPRALAVIVHDGVALVAAVWLPALVRIVVVAAAVAPVQAVVRDILVVMLVLFSSWLDQDLVHVQWTALEAIVGVVWLGLRLEVCTRVLE